MKSVFFIILLGFLTGCTEDLKVNDKKLDKLNDAGKDIQKTVKQGIDTVASKVKKIKIKVED